MITSSAGDIVVSGSYSSGFTLTYSGTSYANTDVPEATVDDSALTMLATDAPTVTKNTVGVANNNEQWSFEFDEPNGFYFISNGMTSVEGIADGTLDASTVQALFESLYGSGNVSVTLTDGDSATGTFTVEFVGSLASTPIGYPPSINTGGSFTGSLSFSSLQTGGGDGTPGGVQEVQTITLPSGMIGGTWSVAGQPVAFDGDASAVESTIEYATNRGVSVTGSAGGPFTVTWDNPGPQSLLSIDTSSLQFDTVTEVTAGDSTTYEVQVITLPSGVTGGTWGYGGLVYNATAAAVEAYLSYVGVSVTGSDGGPYTVTWNSYGSQSLLSIDMGGLTFSGVGTSESTEGVANNNEFWQLTGANYATGPFVIFAGSMNVSDYASGSIGAGQLQTDLEVIYGSGNVAVTDMGSGVLNVEFVGDLAGTEITVTPWLDTSGLVSGGASLSKIAGGVAGVHEVQTIALPSNLVGGTWQINGGSWLGYNASVSAVEACLDVLLGQSVSVVSYAEGQYIVTWDAVGPQDLLHVESIDLKVRNTATVATTQTGGAFGLIAHFVYDAFGNVKSVTNGSGSGIEDGSTVTSITYAGYTYSWSTETYATPNRIYDPKTGNWLSVDPIGFGDGWNTYAYVHNGPTNRTDPTGLWTQDGVIRAYTAKYGNDERAMKALMLIGGVFDLQQGTQLWHHDWDVDIKKRIIYIADDSGYFFERSNENAADQLHQVFSDALYKLTGMPESWGGAARRVTFAGLDIGGGLLTIIGSAGMLAAPEPALTKVGGAMGIATGINMQIRGFSSLAGRDTSVDLIDKAAGAYGHWMNGEQGAETAQYWMSWSQTFSGLGGGAANFKLGNISLRQLPSATREALHDAAKLMQQRFGAPSNVGGNSGSLLKRFGNVDGGSASVKNALTQAEKWLGSGYKEIAPGVYRSADGTRQFRMTTSDLIPTHGNIGPHVHFEAIGPDGRLIIENSHVKRNRSPATGGGGGGRGY